MAAVKLATAIVEISSRGFGALESSFAQAKSRITAHLNDLMRVMAAFGAASGGGLFASIASAADAEKAETAFGVMIQNAEKTKKLLAELNQFSIVTPFSPEEVRSAARVLMSFGVELHELMPLLKMVGDVAAGTGANFADLALILGQVRAKGKLQGEESLQLAERGVAIQQVLAKQLGKTGAELAKMQEQGKVGFSDVVSAFSAMTKEGGLFFQAMEKQSTTFAGLWSTVTGNVQELTKAIGQELIGGAKAFLAVGNQITGVLMAANNATGGFIALAAGLSLALTAVAGSAAAAIVAITALTGGSGLLAIAGMAAGIAAVSVAVGTIGAAVTVLVERLKILQAVQEGVKESSDKWMLAWMTFRDTMVDLFDRAKAAAVGLIESLTGMETGELEKRIFGFFRGLPGRVAEFVLDATEWFQVLAKNWDAVQQLFVNYAERSFRITINIFRRLPEVVSGIMGNMLGNIARLLVAFQLKINAMLANVIAKGLVSGNVEAIIQEAFGMVGTSGVFLASFFDSATGAGEAFATGFSAGLQGGVIDVNKFLASFEDERIKQLDAQNAQLMEQLGLKKEILEATRQERVEAEKNAPRNAPVRAPEPLGDAEADKAFFWQNARMERARREAARAVRREAEREAMSSPLMGGLLSGAIKAAKGLTALGAGEKDGKRREGFFEKVGRGLNEGVAKLEKRLAKEFVFRTVLEIPTGVFRGNDFFRSLQDNLLRQGDPQRLLLDNAEEQLDVAKRTKAIQERIRDILESRGVIGVAGV